MSIDEGLFAWVCEALDPVGTVTMRKMMGGATLYVDGIIFAILDDGELWFKADRDTDSVWDEEGCEKFSFTFKDGRTETMNYRRAPTDVYDDPDSMRHWAKLAIDAGRRGLVKRKPRKSSSKG